jgi:hypothetical protein
MKPTSFKDSELYKRGRNGELIVAEQMQKRGYGVIPCYDFSGEDGNKAPRMQFADFGLVIPDLDLCKGGKRRWGEVKTKFKADAHRKSGDYVHGIDRKHFDSYMSVERESGCPVFIFIVEESTGRILYGPLSELPIHHTFDGYGKGGMVYWNVTEFKELKRL